MGDNERQSTHIIEEFYDCILTVQTMMFMNISRLSIQPS